MMNLNKFGCPDQKLNNGLMNHFLRIQQLAQSSEQDITRNILLLK